MTLVNLELRTWNSELKTCVPNQVDQLVSILTASLRQLKQKAPRQREPKF